MSSKKQLVFWLPVVALWIATVAVSLGFIISRRSSHKVDPHVSFSEWIPVEQSKAKNGIFRFAVASMVSPEESWVTYKQLVEYIAEHIGNDTSMVLRPTYGKVRELLEQNAVQSAFVCTGTIYNPLVFLRLICAQIQLVFLTYENSFVVSSLRLLSQDIASCKASHDDSHL